MCNKKAFTLIELLVVISIISLLASVVLSSLNTARAKARDAVRINDWRTFQSVLLRYNLATQDWPGPDEDIIISRNCDSSPISSVITDLINSGLISEMPTDPAENINTSFCTNVHPNIPSDAYFYGWDSTNSGGDNCFVINNFETDSALDKLAPVNHQLTRNFGGEANADDADFVHCFDE